MQFVGCYQTRLCKGYYLKNGSCTNLRSNRQKVVAGNKRINCRKSFVVHAKPAEPSFVSEATEMATEVAEATFDFFTSPMFVTMVKAATTILTMWVATFVVLFTIKRVAKHSWEIEWKEELQPGGVNILSEWTTFMRALYQPLTFFLPCWVALRSVTVALKATDVIFHQMKREKIKVWKWLDQGLHELIKNLVTVEKFIDKSVYVLLLIFGVWFVIRLKDEFVTRIIDLEYKKDPVNAGELKRSILPLSSILGYILVVVGGIGVLAILGINIQPILTSFGIGSLILGVASQSVMADLISGLNIFISRPFVVGDRIKLNLIRLQVYGIVEHVTPLRTIVRDDLKMQVIVPNKIINQEVLINESRTRSKMTSIFTPGGQQLEIRVNLSGISSSQQLEKIAQKVQQMMNKYDDFSKEYPIKANIDDIQPDGAVLYVHAFTNRRNMQTTFAELKQQILLEIYSIINTEKEMQKKGAVVSADGV